MAKDNLFDYAWGKLAGGGLFLLIAYWLNGTFNELESGARESVRINWIAATLYNLTGHQVTVGIFALIGVASLFFGIKQLMTEGNRA